MKRRIGKPQRGFTLLELMIASAVGLVVIAAMTSLFKIGMELHPTYFLKAASNCGY